MAVARVTEITAGAPNSFEEAMRAGIDRACQTLQNVQQAWVKEQYVKVENGRIVEYRVNMKVTFVLND